jgi:putative ABC transport system permease protein
MGLQLLSGKNIPASTSDSSGNRVLLNEEAIRQFHLGDHRKAAGQLLWLNDSTQLRVAGVVKNFHYMGMAHPILPLMIRYEPKNFNLLHVKVAASVAPENTRIKIRERLHPFIRKGEQDIAWFDQLLYDHHFHGNDQLFMGVLTGMVLSIACLGLLGMVTYTSETRTKEVGIRKVMGASVSQVVMLLSKDFMWLLAIAALLAFPAGIICGVAFLNNFAYHINLGTGTVVTAFLFLFLIGGFTIGWQAFRAASGNPVVTLRTE